MSYTEAKPFQALITISSLLVALLFIAGFSFRWAYYYNFGIPTSVYGLNLESVLTNAFELIRTPENFLLCALYIMLPYALLLLTFYFSEDFRNRVFKRVPKESRALIIDLIKALLLIITTWYTASQIGYNSFVADVTEPESSLPRITVVMKSGSQDNFPHCGASGKSISFIGSGRMVSQYIDNYEGCSSDELTWRLFYKDNSHLYLFAGRKESIAKTDKPLVAVIPLSEVSSFFLNR